MPHKPRAILEGWQLVQLNGRPFQLWGYVTNHPKLPGFRRRIATSRILTLSADQRRAVTLNTNYELRHPITDVVFKGAWPVQILIGDLAAEHARKGVWRIRRADKVVATGLPGMTEAVLAMLALLDRDRPRCR